MIAARRIGVASKMAVDQADVAEDMAGFEIERIDDPGAVMRCPSHAAGKPASPRASGTAGKRPDDAAGSGAVGRPAVAEAVIGAA